MSAPPPNIKSRFTLSVLQCLCQPTKCSPGNFKMQTLKKNTLNPNGTGLIECLSQPQNSPAWLWQPAPSCAELALSPQIQQSSCTSSWNSQVANSSTSERCVSVEPRWFTPPQQPDMPTRVSNDRGAPKRPPDEAWPLTEQPWLCATDRHWKSRSPWWKQCHCPNCSYNLKKLKCYCLPWKDWLPAKLFRHPYSLLAWILGRPVETFGVPAAVLLFCKVSLVDKQTKVPESEWVPSPLSHESKKRASAWPFFPKELWRSLIYRPLV